MAHNKDILFCDTHGIDDGLLRVFLGNDNDRAALDTIDGCIDRSKAKTKALAKLKHRLKQKEYLKGGLVNLLPSDKKDSPFPILTNNGKGMVKGFMRI
jgi:hypothetical protein